MDISFVCTWCIFKCFICIFIYIFLLFKTSIGTEIHGDKFFRNRLPTVQVAI